MALTGTISALVLLFSYHTSTNSTATGPASGDDETSTGGSGTGTPDGATPSPGTSGSGTSGSSSSSGNTTKTTYTGERESTRWGIVQVEITVESGKVTKSGAIQYPQGNPRDQEINSYALPRLDAEVVQQQSARIDAVSGATVTSDGYIQSLQSALDKANL